MTDYYSTTGKGERATFLRDHGLDLEIIPVGDWNEEGYLRVHVNEGGDAKFFGGDPERPVLVFRPWPKGFDYQKWLLLTKSERAHA